MTKAKKVTAVAPLCCDRWSHAHKTGLVGDKCTAPANEMLRVPHRGADADPRYEVLDAHYAHACESRARRALRRAAEARDDIEETVRYDKNEDGLYTLELIKGEEE